MAAETEICVICGSAQEASVMAEHFESCFGRHCPVEILVAEPSILSAQEILHAASVGPWRLPPLASALIFQNFLPPPSLMSFACTSRYGPNVVDKEKLWENTVSVLQSALWSQVDVGFLDLNCTCGFVCSRASTLQDLKKDAFSLWRALNIHSVYFEMKTLSAGKNLRIPIQGVRDGAGRRAPVLLHTSVLHLKTLVRYKAGMLPQDICVLRQDARQLLHESAPLAAYIWDLLQPRLGNPVDSIRLELVLSMSTRRCPASTGNLVGSGAFSFMANIKITSDDAVFCTDLDDAD
jgi:hypothetical protein